MSGSQKPDKPPSRRRGYIYVNNRLEGNAPRTLAAIIQRSGMVANPPDSGK